MARFEREVQLTARLTHPNTIPVFDYGRTPDGVFYYAMEFLDGASLAEVVRHAGPLPPGRVIHILDADRRRAGRGAWHRPHPPRHQAGQHALGRAGGVADVVKVLDFGLVKELGSGRSRRGVTSRR